MKPDIIVYSQDNKPQLVVEVKRKSGASKEWATKMRRNLIVHSAILNAPFFLLALTDRLFLWKNTNTQESRPPDYEIDAKDLFKGYLKHYQEDLDKLSGYSLEIVLVSWLNDISVKETKRDNAKNFPWLYDSGLYDAIKGGSVTIN